jgi:hypothetical protein
LDLDKHFNGFLDNALDHLGRRHFAQCRPRAFRRFEQPAGLRRSHLFGAAAAHGHRPHAVLHQQHDQHIEIDRLFSLAHERQVHHHRLVVEQAGHHAGALREFFGKLRQIGCLQHQGHQRQRRTLEFEARGVDVAADYGAHELLVKV